ncbi:hypothetical protein MKEN_01361800 [Mycena kentingensis (nom. inval.)]|nr:hypothetical protein MKEN_01361800 [Mycena kentingensis (nom. inval.)]
MAPLSAASAATLKPGSEDVYLVHLDEDWVVGNVPNGGYALGVIAQACIVHQATSDLPSPLHVVAHYLNPTMVGTAEIGLRVVKQGKSFVNIVAELEQEGSVRITSHLIFARSTLSTYPLKAPAAGTRFGRLIPLRTHPTSMLATSLADEYPWFAFSSHAHWAMDSSFTEPAGTNGLTRWGAWLELKDPSERITLSSLALLADCFLNLARLWPREVTGGLGWQPTLALSLEWKHPIPEPSEMHSARTVGIYVVSGYLGAPQSRHDTFIEIWTAPAGIAGTKPIRERWREEQLCLGIASQMQLIMNTGRTRNFKRPANAMTKL